MEDWSEVWVFCSCVPRSKKLADYITSYEGGGESEMQRLHEQLTGSWTPCYIFLLVQASLWWTLDRSPLKTQRSRVRSDRPLPTSCRAWSMADVIKTSGKRPASSARSLTHGFYLLLYGKALFSFRTSDSRARHGRCLPVSYQTGLRRHRRTQARVNKQAHPARRTGRAEKRNLRRILSEGRIETQEIIFWWVTWFTRWQRWTTSDTHVISFSPAIRLETKGVAADGLDSEFFSCSVLVS